MSIGTFQNSSIGGNLGGDAVVREVTKNGRTSRVANFNLANKNPFTKKSTWYRVSFWNPLPWQEAALVKGAGVIVNGRGDDGEPFTDKEGNTRVSREFSAASIEFTDPFDGSTTTNTSTANDDFF
jgi:single-stranded DNA-binding protein